MKRVLTLAAITFVLGGCALGEGNNAPVIEKRYITGSSIPMKRLQTRAHDETTRDGAVAEQPVGRATPPYIDTTSGTLPRRSQAV